jgi:hypothetical protein
MMEMQDEENLEEEALEEGLLSSAATAGGSKIYVPVIRKIFFDHYQLGLTEFSFVREEIGTAADALNIKHPKNFGDVLYAFRFRRPLPDDILATAPEDMPWVIRLSGIGRYRFKQTPRYLANIRPASGKVVTKVPDATPSIITKNRLNDEQALLAMLRYNRLVDIFTGVTCYSLQNHLRTTVENLGQTETDEVYLGVDKRGVQYVFPVQAKGRKERLSVVQVEQDYFMCQAKFPGLVCRPIGTQFLRGRIVLFDFEESEGDFAIANERHYRLVPADEISSKELLTYRERLEGD